MMYRMDVPWWLPGAALLVFGLLVAAFPELLALMVALGFVFVGSSLLAAGWAAKRYRQQASKMVNRDEYHWFV